MPWGATTFAFCGLGAATLAGSLATLRRRVELSHAKHTSVPDMPASRSGETPPSCRSLETTSESFLLLRQMKAPDSIVGRRRAAFARLSELYKTRFAETIRCTAEASDHISDLQFTAAYRVPFQYSRLVREHLPSGAFMQSTDGVTVTDLDGNRFYDLTGSYGVNVLGNDFYKAAIERGVARVRELGPLLGPYHPLIIDNVKRLKEISGLDEVSFHMSGTEAVMQAVRLARYHTRRSHVVLLCERLSWLVGRRSARRWQSAAGRPNLHPQGDVRGFAARAAQPQGHRLRAGQPAAGTASERIGADRSGALLTQCAERAIRQGRLYGLA